MDVHALVDPKVPWSRKPCWGRSGSLEVCGQGPWSNWVGTRGGSGRAKARAHCAVVLVRLGQFVLQPDAEMLTLG